jgi:catecholate siderophore receptor
MPSYWLFNVVASYPLGKHVTLRLNVNNLFDEQFVQSFNNNGARFGPGAPRSYLLSADFTF